MAKTYEKNLIKQLGFSPKEKELGVFSKKYKNGYIIEVNFEKKIINYGKDIKCGSKTTQNFSQAENFVVLECINRLLEKGYKPKDIILEKIFPSGHGTSGRLDILVMKENKSYLMIECKTYGDEFDKELRNTHKNGGQIFAYFQQDTKTELLMIYASELKNNKIVSSVRIINIEEDFRNAGSVEKVFNLWNGKFYEKGFWENPLYNFQPEKFIKKNLHGLTEDEGKKLFHGFATILRKHSVSDKPNAFNVIFNLFLAKLYDEQKGDKDELEFQWKSNDDPVDFQVRLYNLHKAGLLDFLNKEIEGIEFNAKDETDLKKQQKKFLKFNKLFDIKSVFNDDDFEQNHRVLKEVVKLIEKYQIRYPRKQKYLSEFFELLLTTGLKQEAGQYFTPPPIAKFIVKSLPLSTMIKQEIDQPTSKLPAVIDYAAGSGHFITEIMEEYQDIIDNLDTSNLHYPNAKTKAKIWSQDGEPYSWAASYVYGIEKDYRLVKVAKVGCYFYGDGLAQVIHGDGLDSFGNSKSYIRLLEDNVKKPQFSIVVSNPPYSVSDCRDDLEYIGSQNDFELYKSLTEKSKEIECLFVERTKQLLKDGGVAGIILPSSILSNEGIYSKTREIILQYFDIVAITQLGSNTFMATGTNTVVMFLRKRNEVEVNRIKKTAYQVAENYPKTKEDLTVNGVEKPVKKYLKYTGETEINPEKFYYYILNYHQKTVIVKTGEKDAEKRFLGYEFSNRRGNEGLHPIQRGKTIDECTKLYDENKIDNPEKASTYIYKAFNGNVTSEIAPSMKDNIFCIDFVDMLTFDRVNFEKNISLVVKKKIKIESKWEIVKLGNIAKVIKGVIYSKNDQTANETNKIILTADNITLDGNFEVKKKVFIQENFKIAEEKKLVANDIFICFSSGSKEHLGKVAYINEDTSYYAGGFMGIIRTKNVAISKYIFQLLNTTLRQVVRDTGSGSNINNLSSVINEIPIPLPSKEMQEKIVIEIEAWEMKEAAVREQIKRLEKSICVIIEKVKGTKTKLHDITTKIGSGATPLGGEGVYKSSGITFIRSQNVYDGFFIEDGLAYIDEEQAKKLDGVTVEKDDILFNITGASIARCCIVENKYLPARVNQHVSIIRTNQNVLPKYVQLTLISKEIKNKLLQIGEGATSRQAITKSQLENFEIPLPPISEQQNIVSKIEELEAQIQDMQKELEQLSNQKELVLKKYL